MFLRRRLGSYIGGSRYWRYGNPKVTGTSSLGSVQLKAVTGADQGLLNLFSFYLVRVDVRLRMR